MSSQVTRHTVEEVEARIMEATALFAGQLSEMTETQGRWYMIWLCPYWSRKVAIGRWSEA